MSFNCSMCGECCRNLKMSPLYSELDRGDGICKFLEGDRCSIYQDRPLICRIDECYDLYFSQEMSKEDYYKQNYEMCDHLRQLKDK